MWRNKFIELLFNTLLYPRWGTWVTTPWSFTGIRTLIGLKSRVIGECYDITWLKQTDFVNDNHSTIMTILHNNMFGFSCIHMHHFRPTWSEDDIHYLRSLSTWWIWLTGKCCNRNKKNQQKEERSHKRNMNKQEIIKHLTSSWRILHNIVLINKYTHSINT